MMHEVDMERRSHDETDHDENGRGEAADFASTTDLENGGERVHRQGHGPAGEHGETSEHARERERGYGRDHDVIIIGAGPAGTTAAMLLARAGLSVALVEKKRFPRRKVCGECLAASNLPLLDALGIADEVMANAGAELRRVTLMHGERESGAALPPARHARFAWGRAIGRESLDDLLLARARRDGVDVLQPWSLRKLDGRTGDWCCELREVGSDVTLRLRTAVLVDAHGSWEPLTAASTPDGAMEGTVRRASDLLAFKANFTGADHRPGAISVLALDGGYGGMVVAGHGVTTVACCVRRDRLEALRADAPGLRAGEVVESWLARDCAGVARALAGATRTGSWLASGPLRPGARVGRADGVFRIGNAAGEAHPILGEGMSMALQSGALLAARLADAWHATERRTERDVARDTEGDTGGDTDCSTGRGGGHGSDRDAVSIAALTDPTLHERHAREWRTSFAPRLRLAAAFAHTAMRPASAALLVSVAGRWPGLLTRGARWGGKVRSVAIPIAPPTLPAHNTRTPA